MSFPDHKYPAAGAFLDDYARALNAALATVDREAIARAADILSATHKRDGTIWACGNGGSAAIANHLVCDHIKGVNTDTGVKPRIHSLSANVELLTAIANDFAYADVFVYPLRMMARQGDTLITISSSGDSENIVRAATWARENGIPVIAMSGFSGGRSAKAADVSLHVSANNYGVIEDAHQALMHILAQYIRQSHMPEKLITERKF